MCTELGCALQLEHRAAARATVRRSTRHSQPLAGATSAFLAQAIRICNCRVVWRAIAKLPQVPSECQGGLLNVGFTKLYFLHPSDLIRN